MTMTDVNGEATHVGDDFIGQNTIEWIDVPIHRADRRDRTESVQNVAAADIAGMENP